MKFILEHNEDTGSTTLHFDDEVNKPVFTAMNFGPDNSLAQFVWLVESAAEFQRCEVIKKNFGEES